MRKIVTVLLALLVLTGCTSAKATMKDPKELFSIGDKKYTEQDILDQIINVDFGQFIIRGIEEEVIQDILKNNDYYVEKLLETELENFEAYALSMGITMDVLITYYGFDKMEDFEEQLRRSVVMDKYIEDMILADLDALVEKYELVNLKAFQVSDEETAKKMVRYIENEYDVSGFEEEFDSIEPSNLIFHSQKENANDITKEKLSTIEKDKITYVVENDSKIIVYLLNEEALEDEAKSKTILAETDFAATAMSDIVKKNGFKVINKQVKKNMSQDFSNYLK